MKRILVIFVLIFSTFSFFTLIAKAQDKSMSTLSGWQTAKASYYNSKDPSQTKNNCNGVGAFGRRIKSGSIAMGSHLAKDLNKKGIVVFIQVKNCNIVTPYGKGIFRVDDTMAKRYSKNNAFHIDFFYKDLSYKQKQCGRFVIEFRIFKIVITADSFS
jgi:hypothetical protein